MIMISFFFFLTTAKNPGCLQNNEIYNNHFHENQNDLFSFKKIDNIHYLQEFESPDKHSPLMKLENDYDYQFSRIFYNYILKISLY